MTTPVGFRQRGEMFVPIVGRTYLDTNCHELCECIGISDYRGSDGKRETWISFRHVLYSSQFHTVWRENTHIKWQLVSGSFVATKELEEVLRSEPSDPNYILSEIRQLMQGRIHGA